MRLLSTYIISHTYNIEIYPIEMVNDSWNKQGTQETIQRIFVEETAVIVVHDGSEGFRVFRKANSKETQDRGAE